MLRERFVFRPSTILMVLFLLSLGMLTQAQETAPVDQGPVAKVVLLKGQATFNGQTLSLHQEISSNGNLAVVGEGVLKIYIAKWQSTIVLGSHSSMEINLSNAKKPGDAPIIYLLEKGICRWVSDQGAKGNNRKGVHTKTAALGVRGTDFLLKENPLLGESEVVVFDGEVLMISKLNDPSEARIRKNQWGGLGGRFGQRIGRILDLPPMVIEEFKKVLTKD